MTPPSATILEAVAAGAASVRSSCFLPALPVLVAGAGFKSGRRPALLAGGLALSFLLMGVVSSLWGDLLVGRTRAIELTATTAIALVGFAGLCAPGPARPRRCAWAAGIGEGWPGGAVLGFALGLVWVPCIGPVLSEILGAIGSRAQAPRGVFLLACYSFGLALPLLAVTFVSHLAQRSVAGTPRRETALRIGATGVLAAFWLSAILRGNLAY